MARPEPERECCLTRTVKPQSELIRFVVSPEGVLTPDVDARAPGRGVWVTLSEAAVEEAVRKKAFTRSLKQGVEMPVDLAHQVRSRLEQRLLGALGLARKAGQLVTGATRVRSAIISGQVQALFTARDAAPDGRQKMLAVSRATESGGSPPHFELLTSDQLSLALGMGNVIHAALSKGAAADAALLRAQRLARYIAGN
jgi:uncharacterized protein